jgi:neutral ceramidase
MLKSHQSSSALSFAILGILVSIFLHIPGLHAQSLSAGAARFDITPSLDLSNWITHKPYGEMLEPVHVRALVLAQDKKRVAVVSWELLYPMEGAVARVRKAITAETGIPETDILVTATHNHSAPWSPVINDPLTGAERKVLDSFLTDTNYPAWANKLLDLTVKAVKQADAARQPATISISRAYVGDILFNRRPIKPDGSVQTMSTSPDPFVMPGALRFGKVDPTMTMLLLRDDQQNSIASIFHLACHPVVVYPAYNGVSSDWPGPVCTTLREKLGGEAIFLQGCAGDIAPIQRGIAARDHIAAVVADRALKAAKISSPLKPAAPGPNSAWSVTSEIVKAPIIENLRPELGREYMPAEVQVITWGSLAIVALPGEPLIGLAFAIQERSPYPHTIVLGYSNGYGTQYVGLPGDRARGGYEMGGRNLGTDECGQLLIDSAVRLLNRNKPNSGS